MRILVTRQIPEVGLELLRKEAEVTVWEHQLPPSRDELLQLADGVDGILSLLTERIDGELLDQLPTVKAVSNLAVGYDNIDVPACTERGVAACITPDVLTDTTADFAFALLMSVARRVTESAIDSKNGEWKTWEPLGYLGKDVYGSTIGIVGLGRIGAAVARRAAGFSMKILYTDATDRTDVEQETGARRTDMDTLLRESDFITLHVPLTPETKGMIGPDQFKAMKSSAILINTSRGPVVQTEALADALESGEIWAAGLDVTDPEPLPADHRLYSLRNALICPHIASATEVTRDNMSELAAKNLLAAIKGEEPPRCLNPEVLGRGRS